MSTKKLERTVIEGGRGSHNKWDRRNSIRPERAAERAMLSEIRKDPLNFDDSSFEEREHVYKDFSDKLGPMYRWLDAQIGRPWDEVRSEIFKKFDTRTLAGRHITFDHLLGSVVETERDDRGYIAANYKTYNNRSHYYYVDQDGILCRAQAREKGWWPASYPKEKLQVVSDWLAGRMIGEKGGTLYWFDNQDGIWKAEWTRFIEHTKYGDREGPTTLKYFSQENGPYEERRMIPLWFGTGALWEPTKRTGLHWEHIANPAGFKQRGPLHPDEVKYFKELPAGMQKEILAFGKVRFS